MLDSKNFIWLSSFFTLLFITFCVTRHIDDLNPHIKNIKTHQATKTISTIPSEPNEDIFVKEITIEKEGNETQTKQQVENNDSDIIKSKNTPKIEEKLPLEKDILHVEPKSVKEDIKKPTKNPNTDSTKERVSTKIKRESKTEKVSLKDVSVKPKKRENKRVKKAPHKKISHKIKTITKIEIDPYLPLDSRAIENLTMIAYKYGIHTKSFVEIKSSNLKKANSIKRVLIKKNVEPNQIKIVPSNDEIIDIILKERI